MFVFVFEELPFEFCLISTDKYSFYLVALVRLNSIYSCFYSFFFYIFFLLYYKHTNRSLKHSSGRTVISKQHLVRLSIFHLFQLNPV